MITTVRRKPGRPRVAKRVAVKEAKTISKRLLERMDADVESLKKGNVSAPIDLEKYAEYS